MKFRLLIILLTLSSCSFKKDQLENQTESGHTALYSEPEAPRKDIDKAFNRVIIASTNDIHGHYQPHQINFKDNLQEENQSIQIGGVDYISSYYKILRKIYGPVLMLDSGDIFSNKAQEMDFVSDFYSVLDYDAITIGIKDFNLKLPAKYQSSADFFKDFSAKSKTPLILSNLFELKTARVVEWPGTLPYLLREVNGVKVGILGVIPDDFIEQIPVDNRIGLYVESMIQATLRQSRLLRSLGAEIIVVLTHQALNCGEEIAQEMKLPLTRVNFEPERSGLCDLSNKMGDYLNRLPPGLVDVVIGGRNNQKTANFINTTLVMNGYNDGKSFSYAEFFVDKKTKKLHKDKTVVHQPVFFCQEFFKETNDCYTDDTTVNHKLRSPALFLGQKIESDHSLLQKFHYFLNINKSTTLQMPANIQPTIEFYGADISYSNSGAGEAKLVMITLKGSELLNILEDDYNQGLASNWKPSPFKLAQTTLSLSLQGSAIESDKDYTILADIEDIQKHPSLQKIIARTGNKSLNNVSWNEPGIKKDDVSTAMAASDTVR